MTLQSLRKPGPIRLALALLLLVAFTLQSFVTQVHVHGATWSVAAHQQKPDKQPTGDDQSGCPICQVIAHSSHFIAPSVAVPAPLATAMFFFVAAQDSAAISQATSHDWRSRAPPKA
jgi:Protein of unknown function (DUF2946)